MRMFFIVFIRALIFLFYALAAVLVVGCSIGAVADRDPMLAVLAAIGVMAAAGMWDRAKRDWREVGDLR